MAGVGAEPVLSLSSSRGSRLQPCRHSALKSSNADHGAGVEKRAVGRRTRKGTAGEGGLGGWGLAANPPHRHYAPKISPVVSDSSARWAPKRWGSIPPTSTAAAWSLPAP